MRPVMSTPLPLRPAVEYSTSLVKIIQTSKHLCTRNLKHPKSISNTSKLTQLSPTLTFPKKKYRHVKPPSPSYFVNFRCLYRSNGLIDKTLAAVDRFSRALAISVSDSPWMYCFCGALTSLFYVLFITFYFLLVFYCSLCSSMIFT